MKFKIPLDQNDDEINMAPMIDMVFLLLIFFMVASHLADLQKVPVLLPVADKATMPEETRDRQMVSILSEDESGETVKIFINMQEMDLAQFKVTLQQLVGQDENLQIYLRADRRVLHKHIQTVMKSCAEAGIVDITFGTFESGK
jgi:biopolymer transport protein ExbD